MALKFIANLYGIQVIWFSGHLKKFISHFNISEIRHIFECYRALNKSDITSRGLKGLRLNFNCDLRRFFNSNLFESLERSSFDIHLRSSSLI